MIKVVLDLGHGGRDPGAIGPTGRKESDVVLLLGHMVKSCLERTHLVYMTRYDDTLIGLQERAGIANREKADLFVSLHCNGHENPTANGIEVWYYTGSNEGSLAAQTLQNTLVDGTGWRDRGIKQTTQFTVLAKTKMPAILLETGFITNPAEEESLGDVRFLHTLACLIGSGIKDAVYGWPGVTDSILNEEP